MHGFVNVVGAAGGPLEWVDTVELQSDEPSTEAQALAHVQAALSESQARLAAERESAQLERSSSADALARQQVRGLCSPSAQTILRAVCALCSWFQPHAAAASAHQPCMTDIYLQFECAHHGIY